MHASDRKPVESFNILIGINNNRIECYRFALKNCDSAVLNALFTRLVETSLFCNHDLAREVYKLGGVPRQGTVATGLFLKAWLNVHDAVRQDNNRVISDAILYAECMVAASYSLVALRYSDHLNAGQSAIISTQINLLRGDFQKVVNLSDVFDSRSSREHPERASGFSFETTFQLIEPIKTAGRRILAAFAPGDSNFGPSIR